MAEGIFMNQVRTAGRADQFEIASAGTASYHAGSPPDRRTLEVLARHGIRLESRSRQVTDADFARFDLILAMDRSNLDTLSRRCPPQYRDKLHLTLEPTTGGDVPDPYYGGPQGFDLNYAQLLEALEAWLERLS
jgi:protein-tyrosine phosphatase